MRDSRTELKSPEHTRVLIVSDQSVELLILGRLLGYHGYQVRGARTSEAVFRSLTRTSFDVVICNLQMVTMSGLELFERLQQTHPDAARILITPPNKTNIAVGALKQGTVFRYVTEPIEPNELIEAVRMGCRQRQVTVDQDRAVALKADRCKRLKKGRRSASRSTNQKQGTFRPISGTHSRAKTPSGDNKS